MALPGTPMSFGSLSSIWRSKKPCACCVKGCCGLCHGLYGHTKQYSLPISGMTGEAAIFNGNWTLSQYVNASHPPELQWCRWGHFSGAVSLDLSTGSTANTFFAIKLTRNSDGKFIYYFVCGNILNCMQTPWVFSAAPGQEISGYTPTIGVSPIPGQIKKCGICCSQRTSEYPSVLYAKLRGWFDLGGGNLEIASCLEGMELPLKLIPPTGPQDPPFGQCNSPQYAAPVDENGQWTGQPMNTNCPWLKMDYMILYCYGLGPNMNGYREETKGFLFGFTVRTSPSSSCSFLTYYHTGETQLDCDSMMGTFFGVVGGFEGFCSGGISTNAYGYIDITP